MNNKPVYLTAEGLYPLREQIASSDDSANRTVSLTFSVPLTICDEFTRNKPGTEVSVAGTRWL